MVFPPLEHVIEVDVHTPVLGVTAYSASLDLSSDGRFIAAFLASSSTSSRLSKVQTIITVPPL